MTMYGAVPDQLANLGANLTRQIESINQVMSTVDSAINNTTWTGPARDRFVEDWNSSFKGALGRLNEAFGEAGKGCSVRAEELRRLMGVG